MDIGVGSCFWGNEATRYAESIAGRLEVLMRYVVRTRHVMRGVHPSFLKASEGAETAHTWRIQGGKYYFFLFSKCFE